MRTVRGPAREINATSKKAGAPELVSRGLNEKQVTGRLLFFSFFKSAGPFKKCNSEKPKISSDKILPELCIPSTAAAAAVAALILLFNCLYETHHLANQKLFFPKR